jgi:NAD(P)-dependent dehydrogenase (short-subunit alcohol dehydrogenase family)
MANRGTVFVSGSSSGIGRATVELLAGEGYFTIAGVRAERDAPQASSAVAVLDMAKEEMVGPACEKVLALAADNGGLAGVVNNAGMIVGGPGEVLEVGDWRRQFEVNFFGHLAVTRELLPALRDSRGCLINIGSIGGRISMPFLGPYSASKFAMRAWSDALRLEMKPNGVRVVLVEPGAIATPMWAKGHSNADEIEERLGEEERGRYRQQIVAVRNLATFAERNAVSPEQVARVIANAISNPRPTGRYLVGRDAWVQALVSILPTRLLDAAVELLMSLAGEGGLFDS